MKKFVKHLIATVLIATMVTVPTSEETFLSLNVGNTVKSDQNLSSTVTVR